MATRIITALIGLIVFFAVYFANETAVIIAVTIISMIMVYETLTALKTGKFITIVSMMFPAILQLPAIFNKELSIFNGNFLVILLVAFFGVYMVCSIKQFGKTRIENIYSGMFSTLYISLFMYFIILIRAYGRHALIPIFIYSWLTDTGAYFSGYFFGKHKLAPNLSPKKTIEGFIGGIITSVVGVYIYVLIFEYLFNIKIQNYWIMIAAAPVGAGLSALGDLAASALKRQCDIKDFGKIFPGHGGMMDRFDSVVFAVPFVYLVFKLMEIVG